MIDQPSDPSVLTATFHLTPSAVRELTFIYRPWLTWGDWFWIWPQLSRGISWCMTIALAGVWVVGLSTSWLMFAISAGFAVLLIVLGVVAVRWLVRHVIRQAVGEQGRVLISLHEDFVEESLPGMRRRVAYFDISKVVRTRHHFLALLRGRAEGIFVSRDEFSDHQSSEHFVSVWEERVRIAPPPPADETPFPDWPLTPLSIPLLATATFFVTTDQMVTTAGRSTQLLSQSADVMTRQPANGKEVFNLLLSFWPIFLVTGVAAVILFPAIFIFMSEEMLLRFSVALLATLFLSLVFLSIVLLRSVLAKRILRHAMRWDGTERVEIYEDRVRVLRSTVESEYFWAKGITEVRFAPSGVVLAHPLRSTWIVIPTQAFPDAGATLSFAQRCAELHRAANTVIPDEQDFVVTGDAANPYRSPGRFWDEESDSKRPLPPADVPHDGRGA